LRPFFVIASEAKQSSFVPQLRKLDCFVAEPVIGRAFATRWLLAMTRGAAIIPSAVIVRLDRTIQYAAAFRLIADGGDYWMPRFRGA